MPPPLLVDFESIDLNAVVYDQAFIYGRMPHRYEFQLLDGVCHMDRDTSLAVAYRDCREDEWWVRGHIPSRPIFPGVLQLEVGAHLIAFMSRYVDGLETFVAFGGVEACRFREAVIPPCRLYIVAKLTENRSRRVVGNVQGIVDDRMVFHAQIAGYAFP